MNRHTQSHHLERIFAIGAAVLVPGSVGFISIADAGVNAENGSG